MTGRSAMSDDATLARSRMRELMDELSTARSTIDSENEKLNAAIKTLTAVWVAAVEGLEPRCNDIVDELAALYDEFDEELVDEGTKIVDLSPAGIMRSKLTPITVDIDDSAKGKRLLFARMRKARLLKRFSKLGERVLDKKALNNATDAELEALGLERTRSRTIYIEPSRVNLVIECSGPRFSVRKDASVDD